MRSIEGLFPWIIIALGIVLFTFGLWGVIGGIIMIIGSVVYFYKNNRKAEFKVICSILGVILVICIISMVLFTSVTTHTTTTNTIAQP